VAKVPEAERWRAAELLVGDPGDDPLVLGPWEGRVLRA
jgi:hypothetical protein